MLVLISITKSTFIYGQNSSMLDKLQGKTWIPQSEPHNMKYQYTQSIQTTTRNIKGKDMPINNSFYLSDEVEWEFNNSKVGKIKNGKYIVINAPFGIVIYENGESPNAVTFEILNLDNTELKLKSLFGDIYIYRALEVFDLKYILSQVPAEKNTFDITKNTAFLPSYDFPVNVSTIPDRRYTNVQLTQYSTVSGLRGRVFRKYTPTGIANRHILVVSFGDAKHDRTDVLCLVDNNGKILATLEGMVIVNGITVKQYRMAKSGDGVTIYRVVPNSSTSLSFENITGFSGYISKQGYSITNGNTFSSMKTSDCVSKTGTFTESILSNQNKNIWQYVINGTTVSYGE